MTTPKVGRKVRGSTTGRPIMVIFDLLGRRWTMRILWELNAAEPCTFRVLRARCDNVSPTVLNRRLKELRENRLVVQEPGSGYSLTPDGRALFALLDPMREWAKAWAEAEAGGK